MSRHYLISGRVQGVGYRRFAERVANELQLTGVVRNLRDGRVEAVAEGSPGNLAEFEKRLNQGPSASLVTDVVASEWRTGDDRFGAKPFIVEPDGSEPWQQNK